MGESLGNDGTSLMLFELFLMLVLSNNQVAGSEIVTLVARSLLLSPLLGMATGFLTYLWLRSLKRTTKETDILIQIGITLCSCYLTFYVSQYTFQARYIIIYHHHYYYPHYHHFQWCAGCCSSWISRCVYEWTCHFEQKIDGRYLAVDRMDREHIDISFGGTNYGPQSFKKYLWA